MDSSFCIRYSNDQKRRQWKINSMDFKTYWRRQLAVTLQRCTESDTKEIRQDDMLEILIR